jgi:aldose 1-epimerase
VRLAGGDAAAVVDLEAGGRLSSLAVRGVELLVGPGDGRGPTEWGCFPMAPWAGRLRHGRLCFEGGEHQMPLTLPPHAIHGTVLRQRWHDEGGGLLWTRLEPPWPFGGRVVQRLSLSAGAVHLVLEVHAGDRPMPVSCGWHPWWRRPVTLDFAPGAMWERGADGIPTGRLVPPPARLWDDCFTDLARPPVLRWPGGPEVTIESSCEHVVVFDEPIHALCVEPQTAPPNSLTVVEPGRPLVAEATFRWAAPAP